MPKAATRLLLATACIAITVATPANATLFEQVFTGFVTTGYDDTGFFGAGQDLTGLEYTATYLIDDSKGVKETSPTSYSIFGGIINGLPESSPVSAKLTINGITISVSGNLLSYSDNNLGVMTYMSNPVDRFVLYSEDKKANSNYVNEVTRIYHNIDVDSTGFNKPDIGYSNDFIPISIYGSFNKYDSTDGINIYADFDVIGFTSNTIAAVPEPASWALMIGGFGLIGGTLRRIRQTPSRALATA